MGEKARGFGGMRLQCSPSLVVIVFGVPQTLEQAPQRAVQAALALRQLVTEVSEGEPHPELRMAVQRNSSARGVPRQSWGTPSSTP
jgi:hypothetical protein